MKLNLLPTTVAKASGSRTGAIFGVVVAVFGIIVALGMIFSSQAAMATAKSNAEQYQQPAADALATAQAAETQIASASVIVNNQMLAEAMTKHNTAYVNLYNKVFRYVPSYYRLTSISAAPTGATGCTVTLTGQLQTFTQYADLAIALWKIPGVQNVTRAGYVVDTPQVPALTETDQIGAPVKPGEAPLPSDPLERLQAMIDRASAAPTGYENIGGFGSTDDTTAKGAMDGWSTVTMALQMPDAIQTPDPRASILANKGAGGTGVPAQGFNTAGGSAR